MLNVLHVNGDSGDYDVWITNIVQNYLLVSHTCFELKTFCWNSNIFTLFFLNLVSGTPTSLSYIKQGPASAELMWLAPLYPLVTGFEVFYESSNGETLSEEIGVGALQDVTLSLSLQPDQNYTVFVVAYGGDLPSERSNTITIPQGQLNHASLVDSYHNYMYT